VLAEEFLRNKSDKPVLGLAIRVPKLEYLNRASIIRGHLERVIQETAEKENVEIGPVKIETFQWGEDVYVKATAEIKHPIEAALREVEENG